MVNKIPARPEQCLCCGAEPRLYTFIHNDKKCNGILYLGYLQKEEITVCSECRLIQEIKDVKWICPECGDVFRCNKIKNNKNLGGGKNNYLLKPISNLNNKKNEKIEKKIKYDDIRIKMAGSSRRNNENINNPKNLRGKSYNKKIVTSKIVNLNLQKLKSDEYGIKRDQYMIKEEDELYSNYEPKTSMKEIPYRNNNKIEKLSNYILSKKKSKEEKSEKNIIFLNSLQTPLSIGDKKLKYFKRNKHSIKNDKSNLDDDSRLNQNKKFIHYNKELIKNNIDRNSLIKSELLHKNNHKRLSQLPQSDKNISLNLQININNINFNNTPIIENNNYYNQRIKTALSRRIERNFNLNKKEKILKYLEKDYDRELIEIEPDENFIPEDFEIIKQIGEGTFGKIFCIEWPKNKKKYDMKKMILRTLDELSINQEKTNLLFNFIKIQIQMVLLNYMGTNVYKKMTRNIFIMS